MIHKNISLHFQGFHPSEYIKSYFYAALEEIQHEAPYGATILATVSRKDNLFKATAHVNTGHGPFFAAATDSSLKSVADQILERLRRRIEKWESKSKKAENYFNHIKKNYLHESEAV